MKRYAGFTIVELILFTGLLVCLMYSIVSCGNYDPDYDIYGVGFYNSATIVPEKENVEYAVDLFIESMAPFYDISLTHSKKIFSRLDFVGFVDGINTINGEEILGFYVPTQYYIHVRWNGDKTNWCVLYHEFQHHYLLEITGDYDANHLAEYAYNTVKETCQTLWFALGIN